MIAFRYDGGVNVATTTAYIALGSNLGDRAANIARALELLNDEESVRVTAVSKLLDNPAVGGPTDSPPFLNAAARVETTLSPHHLLDRLLAIEASMGRERRTKWEPRFIDLDLLLYGNVTISDDRLTIPHPLLHQRRFVLLPLSEVGPDVFHPALGQTISELLGRGPE